jgi:hypothetical protein
MTSRQVDIIHADAHALTQQRQSKFIKWNKLSKENKQDRVL